MLLKLFKLKYSYFLLLLLSASIISANEPILNSEKIEKKFGSYGIDVITNSNETRISFLFSHDKQNPNKKNYHTLAIVSYQDTSNLGHLQIQIDNGASIGSTLKEGGWSVRKKHLQTDQISTSIHPILYKWLDLKKTQQLAIHSYKLIIVKKHLVLNYADIIEIHHPRYISPAELKVMYPESPTNISDHNIDSKVSKYLANESTKNTLYSLLKH